MSTQDKTKFTVIIPTRERCDTLQWALKTCTTQEYENLEIIVSDNCSQDNTRQVVESFQDERIRYINTGRRLSMSHNWEFALSHVKDGYVTFIGDDDGLMPNALAELDEIVRDTSCGIVTWQKALYTWPNFNDPAWANMITLRTSATNKKLITVNSREKLQGVLQMKLPYNSLPSLYDSIISHDIIQHITNRSGQFFYSQLPDVYSAIAIAGVTDTYLYSPYFYTLGGSSQRSTGASWTISEKQEAMGETSPKKAVAPIEQFLSEDNIPFHEKLVFAPSTEIVVAECLLQAQDHLGLEYSPPLDMKQVLKAAVVQAAHLPPRSYQMVINAVKEIGQLNHLEAYANQLISKSRKTSWKEWPVLGLDVRHKLLVIEGNQFELRNIYDACVLSRYVLMMKRAGYLSIGGILKTTRSKIAKALRRKVTKLRKVGLSKTERSNSRQ